MANNEAPTPTPGPTPPPTRAQIRRDLWIDMVGNLALAAGLWGAFSGSPSLPWLHTPAVFIPLLATGILNLVHLPARLRRLKAWQQR